MAGGGLFGIMSVTFFLYPACYKPVFLASVFWGDKHVRIANTQTEYIFESSDFSSIVWRWIHSPFNEKGGVFFGTSKFEKTEHTHSPAVFWCENFRFPISDLNKQPKNAEDLSWFFQILNRDFRPGFST